MKNLFILIVFIMGSLNTIASEGYKVGAVAKDFSLKNVDGKMISLNSIPNAKGIIVVFTCNHCPYSKAYEDRLIDLHNKYAAQGYPVIAISSNDPTRFPADSYENMIVRAEEKKFPFLYAFDETQEIARTYGATRTPHIFLLDKQGDQFRVAYIGAIDDNVQYESDVKAKYLEDAIEALKSGKKPDPDFTKAIGCTIKWKK
ncbi:MAG: thioredoxin family protein [Bacteroidetes bacterium]|nr:thioredoxin family protein [Bacteroidota bacterium]